MALLISPSPICSSYTSHLVQHKQKTKNCIIILSISQAKSHGGTPIPHFFHNPKPIIRAPQWLHHQIHLVGPALWHSGKSYCLRRQYPIWSTGLRPVPLVIQFPANAPGKAAEDCPSPWAPANPREIQGRLLHPGCNLSGLAPAMWPLGE